MEKKGNRFRIFRIRENMWWARYRSANSPAHDAGTNSETTNNANVQKVLQETSLEMIKISLVSSEASDNSNNSAEIQNLQGVCPSQDSTLNLQGGESLSETLSTLGTIHILRKHLYSIKLNLTTYFFTKTCFSNFSCRFLNPNNLFQYQF